MTRVSGLCGLESLWLLAQSFSAATNVHVMICLYKIYSECYIKQQWMGFFFNVSLPLPDKDHLLSFCWALELWLIYFFKLFIFGLFLFQNNSLHQISS